MENKKPTLVFLFYLILIILLDTSLASYACRLRAAAMLSVPTSAAVRG